MSIRYWPARRLFSAIVCTVATLWAVSASAVIDSNLAVSPATHMNGGGCYPVSIMPALLDMLVLIDPEWAAVDVGPHLPPFADPITVHGTVNLSKINEGGDFPSDHVTDDQNTFATIDPADQDLVATGNARGLEAGDMELEWEISSYPLFAWAGTGDRYTGVGRWIWDCGHPNVDPPGHCSATMAQACILDSDCAAPPCPSCVAGETCMGVTFNYSSELHPPQAVAITRTHGYRTSQQVHFGRRATRTEVWINPDGGGAGDACLLAHLGNPAARLAQECYPLSQPIADVNRGDFEFDIALPPRPSGEFGPPRIRVFDRTPQGLPRPRVRTSFTDGPTPIVHAIVDMTTPIGGVLPSKVGKTIIARWAHDHTPVTHLRVDITALEILNPLKRTVPAVAVKQRCSETTMQDCSNASCPTGEHCLTLGGPTPGWQIFLEVNGDWKAVPGLAAVDSSGTIPLALSYDLGVLPGDTVHLHASGKSLGCLESQLYGRSLAKDVALYGLTDGTLCLADLSRDIGKFDLNYAGPDFGGGHPASTYVTQSVGGAGGHCSVTTSRNCLDDSDCESETCVQTGGSFKLHYTVTKLDR